MHTCLHAKMEQKAGFVRGIFREMGVKNKTGVDLPSDKNVVSDAGYRKSPLKSYSQRSINAT